MIVKGKYIQLVLFVLLFFLGACDSDMSDINGIIGTTNAQEQMILRLNVQQESVIQTRGTGSPADEDKIGSVDLLIFDNNGKNVCHQHLILEWTGKEYKTTVNIPSATGKHTLYLIANYQMQQGTIKTLQQLKNKICESAEAFIKPPFAMATKGIELSSLSMITVRDAMGNDGFNLKRNVAKFSVKSMDNDFKLISTEWIGCPTKAAVLTDVDYTSSSTKSGSNQVPSDFIYLYQIQDMGSDAHKGFYVVVHGEYTTVDGVKKEGYYKLRLYTLDEKSGKKVPLTSIVGNSYYKLEIRRVTGFGASSLENAEKNGFTNAMEALMILEYSGAHDYQEYYLRNGYQMGFENSHWVIYSSEAMNSFSLGYFYRCIRDESLKDYTVFDPDYPNRQRGVITVKTNGKEIITGETVCKDSPDKPVEMELVFTDPEKAAGTEYTFTSIIQYGVLQRTVTVERYPSVRHSYTVLPIEYANSGEVEGSLKWIGIAKQRYEGATLYQQLELNSDNENLFVHVLKNDTGKVREGKVRLFGRNGYFELNIHQEGN